MRDDDPVHRLTPKEMTARAQVVADRLGVSIAEAFAMYQRGQLAGTIDEVELYMLTRFGFRP